MTQTFNYDGFGQLQSQTGIGNYQYNSKNQLTNISGYTKSNQAQFTGATYDYNGNLLGDGVRDFHYTSYNKAQTINKGSDSVQFIYGINHKRFARLQSVNGETTSTAYIAGGVEKVVKGSHIQYRTTVQNTILTDSNGDNEHAEAYLHKDRQGSPITITNQDGRVVQQFGYGPFGKVYQLQSDSNLFAGGIAPTNRHYTGHESVDDFGLIHMNG